MQRRTSPLLITTLVLLFGCDAGDKSKPADKPAPAAAEPAVEVDPAAVADKDGSGAAPKTAEPAVEIPKDWPIALPQLQKVLSHEVVDMPDKTKTYGLVAEAKSNDLPALAKDLTAELEGKGLVVVQTDLPSSIMVSGKSVDGKLEAHCIFTASEDPAHPGATVVYTWMDHSAAVGE